MKPLPLPEALRRASFGLPDLVVILGVLTLLGLIAHLGSGARTRSRSSGSNRSCAFLGSHCLRLPCQP